MTKKILSLTFKFNKKNKWVYIGLSLSFIISFIFCSLFLFDNYLFYNYFWMIFLLDFIIVCVSTLFILHLTFVSNQELIYENTLNCRYFNKPKIVLAWSIYSFILLSAFSLLKSFAISSLHLYRDTNIKSFLLYFIGYFLSNLLIIIFIILVFASFIFITKSYKKSLVIATCILPFFTVVSLSSKTIEARANKKVEINKDIIVSDDKYYFLSDDEIKSKYNLNLISSIYFLPKNTINKYFDENFLTYKNNSDTKNYIFSTFNLSILKNNKKFDKDKFRIYHNDGEFFIKMSTNELANYLYSKLKKYFESGGINLDKLLKKIKSNIWIKNNFTGNKYNLVMHLLGKDDFNFQYLQRDWNDNLWNAAKLKSNLNSMFKINFFDFLNHLYRSNQTKFNTTINMAEFYIVKDNNLIKYLDSNSKITDSDLNFISEKMVNFVGDKVIIDFNKYAQSELENSITTTITKFNLYFPEIDSKEKWKNLVYSSSNHLFIIKQTIDKMNELVSNLGNYQAFKFEENVNPKNFYDNTKIIKLNNLTYDLINLFLITFVILTLSILPIIFTFKRRKHE